MVCSSERIVPLALAGKKLCGDAGCQACCVDADCGDPLLRECDTISNPASYACKDKCLYSEPTLGRRCPLHATCCTRAQAAATTAAVGGAASGKVLVPLFAQLLGKPSLCPHPCSIMH